jgi:Transcriptional regulator, AbiEi antitoxin, Type IV TA system
MVNTENTKPGEPELARRIAAELPRLLPNLAIEHIRTRNRLNKSDQPDLVARVRFGPTARDLLFKVDSLGEPRFAELAITRLRRWGRTHPKSYLVFAAPYVSERSREICRSEDVGYVDLVGDTYLRFGPVLIDRASDAGHPIERRGVRSLLAPKATRVIRALLQSPTEPARITDLAKSCSMSPAGIYFVAELLENKGFIRRDQSRRIVVPEPRRLLMEWAQNWSVEKSKASRYFSFEKGPEGLISKISEKAKALGIEYAFTGMAGASFVAPFTRYDDVWLYTRGGGERLREALDLRPVSTGANVVLLDPYDEGVFMGAREIRGSQVVSDIQLFVDLYTNPARGQEQADQIMEKAIRFPETQ